MQSGIYQPYVNGAAPINAVQAIKTALHKFPRTKAAAGVQLVTPKIFYRFKPAYESPRAKAQMVKRELLDAGATAYGLLKSESRFLPRILHPDEHIEAVIYGQHNASSAMLAATDERIIYLDKKPMAEMFDEVSYEVVSGIEFDVHMFFATVVLHTAVKNYEFKFVNLRCAEKFARHIEKHRLEREPKQERAAVSAQIPAEDTSASRSLEDMNYMAGYYLLPADEEERRRIQSQPHNI